MKKSGLKRGIGIVIALLWGLAFLTVPLINLFAEEPNHVIVLDPGHGGKDGGAVGDDGTVEKELNLTIALILKERLEAEGITVIMTRQSDEDTDGLTGFHKRHDLEERARIGNESGADAYISIHINASTVRKDHGFQVWYGSGNPEGERLANTLTKTVTEKNICTRIRAVKQVPETLYIFRTVTVPAVLVECGFISNAADLYQLKQTSFQNDLCDAVCKGIKDYLSGKREAIK